jgi:tellurite resistance protein TehA-like permease
MTEPWFDENYWAWLPGTVLGCLGGLWGALGGVLAPQGKAKRLVFGFGLLLVGLSSASLVAGLVALTVGQPYGVWYGLLLPGDAVFIIGALFPVVRRRYREAEARRMQAEDFN